MDGILVIDKPAGWTSFDVVNRLRPVLGVKKAGHLGTLDPSATGVLPVVCGRATRSSIALDAGVKEYAATLRLGMETDTYDLDGKVVWSADASAVTGEAARGALMRFMGTIEQIPPMFSSVKHKGVPLYKLARKGVVVERMPKTVRVFGLEVVSVNIPDVEFTVICSRGTYIRSICHDAGKSLGCGGCLARLKRTRCGPFTIGEAISPLEERGELIKRLIPLHKALERVAEAVANGPAAVLAKTGSGEGEIRFLA
ncbi:MAG: tRNA pseudouridine(55) synthase TruB [Deltaproteobacteria bacterium]|nr:tRNA pseudouridine(55) synthase TruB [Deltaproteobacteria bacterium]